MKEVFDPLRRMWVKGTPEEIVRQQWLAHMLGHLGFPKELMGIEKELSTLPHLQTDEPSLPLRRIDMISFMQQEGVLKPLLLLECKQSKLTSLALDQVISYNYYVQAPYVGIVGKAGILLQYTRKSGSYQSTVLPSYHQLIADLLEDLNG
ncbi:MAG: type I restriction enzyme HsdR N-terminal domain-containing protein [Candidatus Rhabdochlamydia sp.]